jgi:hypothetical protein
MCLQGTSIQGAIIERHSSELFRTLLSSDSVCFEVLARFQSFAWLSEVALGRARDVSLTGTPLYNASGDPQCIRRRPAMIVAELQWPRSEYEAREFEWAWRDVW